MPENKHICYVSKECVKDGFIYETTVGVSVTCQQLFLFKRYNPRAYVTL